MRKEFMVERQGKQFVLYAGLLNLAHEKGLKSILTELIQVPCEDNNRVAICKATVTLERDGVEYTFQGIGDAAPNNVAPAMQTALIRLAETRAKARAMRDAVDVGVTALEELGDEDPGERRAVSTPQNPVPLSAQRGRARAPQPSVAASTEGQCPSCFAPAGKAHTKNCKAALQMVG